MICTKCSIDKPTDEFHKNSKSKTGCQAYCKLCVSNVQKNIYIKNRDSILEYKAAYRSTPEFKQKSRIYESNYAKIRKINGKSFKTKFGGILRDILRRCLKHTDKVKTNSTYTLLGYDTQKLKQRIESQFKSGMSWDNYGQWHIDHKKPISKFSKDSSISTINALCNLQPLWALDNRQKYNKY